MSEPAFNREIAASYEALRNGLLSYLRHRVEDSATAEDLLHTVFLKALASNRSIRAPERSAAWLHKIARNTLIDYYRSKRPMCELPEDLTDETEEDSSSVQALSACLLPLAQRMPKTYREILLATEFQGKTLRAAASELGLSVPAAKSRASRGRRMLKDRLLACCHIELTPTGEIADHRLHPNAQPCKCA